MRDVLRPPALAAMLISCSGLVAQQVWTVGGSNPDFTSIPPAVAAANDGDVILVRTGQYNVGTGIVTNKALRLLGEPNTVLLCTSLNPCLQVAGLPAGKTFVMEGFDIRRSYYGSGSIAPPIDLRQNAGSVHLADLVVRGLCAVHNPGFNCDRAMIVTQCANVTMRRSTVMGLTVDVNSSDMAFDGCTLVGRPGAPTTSYSLSSTEAVLSVLAHVTFAGCSVTGGPPLATPGSVAMGIIGGSCVIAGDAASVVAAGAGVADSMALGVGAVVTIEPAVTLNPPSIQMLSGAIPVRYSPRPAALQLQGGGMGQTVDASVVCGAGEAMFLFAGLFGTVPTPTGIGDTLLDPGTVATITAGIQGPTEHWTYSTAVPSNPALLGAVFGFQAMVGGNGAPPRLSTHSAVMLR